ncbi:putative pyruvate dehydrogenase E1 component subunit alpha, mitochondrial [Lycorma delicatula]|uniref:putative pyruvate dehydrogenase E1 component subunit alpha, mitochondrial n=1 Tax=Lycorma delicatula TaxID=130591 RepID=UPI003F50DC96
MKTIREMETVAARLYREKAIRGFCHLYSGQEACAVGMKASMRENDQIIAAYRVHGLVYVMGISVLGVLAELTGRKSGCVRGKGGSMHMYAKNFYGGNGIVGTQVPLGTGLAFANKYKGNDAVCFSLYGDGAANQGQVFEAFNLAKLWDLPIVFVCENNHYAMGTASDRGSASIKYYTRGDYIPGIWVNGMNILEVREATKFAIDYAKSNGPILMETETYRYHGHSLSDPGTSYRTREEIQQVRETQDPIKLYTEKILAVGLITNEEIKGIDKQIKDEINIAAQKCKSDPEVSVDEMTADIYSLPIEEYVRGTHPWQRFQHKRVGTTLNLDK